MGESLRTSLPAQEIQPPSETGGGDWDALWEHGGFPEPLLRRDSRFSRRWRSLRLEQLSRGDLREVAQITELGAMETLMQLLAESSAQQSVYSNWHVRFRSPLILSSVGSTCSFACTMASYRPWFKNIAKSLRKEPKWFLRDWSGLADDGMRAETFVACHLLKAVEGWTDLGLGDFELRYLRDEQKREVDFLVVRDRKPWFLVKAKLSETALSSSLAHFQAQAKASHAFQAVINLPYEPVDCFRAHQPVAVPARIFLSQLL